jgi:hypothetical protein
VLTRFIPDGRQPDDRFGAQGFFQKEEVVLFWHTGVDCFVRGSLPGFPGLEGFLGLYSGCISKPAN